MTNELRGVEKKNGESISTFSASVPRPAFEIIKVRKNVGKKKNAEKQLQLHYVSTGYNPIKFLIQVNRIAKYSADVGKVWGKYLYLQQSKIQPASL